MWLFLIQFFFLKTQPFWLYSLPLFSLLCMLANCSANPLDQSQSPIHFSRSKLVLSYPTIRALPKISPKEDNNSRSTKASHSQRHNPFLTNNSHHFLPSPPPFPWHKTADTCGIHRQGTPYVYDMKNKLLTIENLILSR